MNPTKKQQLFIITGASCVGKSTLCEQLFLKEKEYIVRKAICYGIKSIIHQMTTIVNTAVYG